MGSRDVSTGRSPAFSWEKGPKSTVKIPEVLLNHSGIMKNARLPLSNPAMETSIDHRTYNVRSVLL